MSEYYIGLMSGTSIDAIDAVLVDFQRDDPLVAAHVHPIPAVLQQRLHRVIEQQQASLAEISQCDTALGECFAHAVNALLAEANVAAEQIIAIGSHGQTIWHAPRDEFPSSWQIGDPNVITARTGITTIADWRRHDVACGGQGAPLTPVFHAAYFGMAEDNRGVLNIGGISNLTVIPAGSQLAQYGFDCGPGNTLMDAWIRLHRQCDFDANGEWARSGTVQEALLTAMLADPYFSQQPPKSTGREYFNLQWLQSFSVDACAAADVQATLCALTVTTITHALRQYCSSPATIILCGGGVDNTFLFECLQQLGEGYNFIRSDALGISSAWLEAIAFAWFAKQRLARQPLDLTNITGSTSPVLLGGIYH